MMFSINAGYDYHHSDYANGSAKERMDLYRRCEKEGIGITVMKPFSGGQLLDAKTSPFGKALTPYQCIQYALDKPGVLTVVPGVKNTDDVKSLLHFFDIPKEERDYSVIGSFAPKDVCARRPNVTRHILFISKNMPLQHHAGTTNSDNLKHMSKLHKKKQKYETQLYKITGFHKLSQFCPLLNFSAYRYNKSTK